jgi:hypothetical protein
VAAAALVSPAQLTVSIQKPKSEFEKEMIYLEAEIRRLEAEFNMFFAGRLPRPPWETRAKVATLVKRHDQSFIRNTADRFRFESLQNKFYKFLELWERQMTNRELGRPVMGAKRSQPPPSPPNAQEKAKNEEQQPAPAAAAQHAKAAVPPVAPEAQQQKPAVEDRVKQLYEQLTAAKQQAGEAPVAIDRVAALVKAQVDKFKAAGQDVQFKVALKDGKVQLTAMPVKDEK